MEFQKSAAKALGEDLPDTRTQYLEYIYRAAFERLVKSRGLIGDLEHCRARIEHLRNLGVDEIACLIDFGIDVDVTMEALKNLDRLLATCTN